jgi:hypothetical protein
LLCGLGRAHRQLLPAAVGNGAVERGNGGSRLHGTPHADNSTAAAQPDLGSVPAEELRRSKHQTLFKTTLK